jgi:hypothetical protein
MPPYSPEEPSEDNATEIVFPASDMDWITANLGYTPSLLIQYDDYYWQIWAANHSSTYHAPGSAIHNYITQLQAWATAIRGQLYRLVRGS